MLGVISLFQSTFSNKWVFIATVFTSVKAFAAWYELRSNFKYIISQVDYSELEGNVTFKSVFN